jgi:hypothetical protein
VVAGVTALVIYAVSAAGDGLPIVHDEAAYLFQAQTFAAGRLTNPPPALPEFFEQFHLLVEPTFSARYPPGFALLLVPGIWLGAPAAVSAVLAALTAWCMFAQVLRATDAWIATIAWLIWLSTSASLSWSASFLSQTATAALWWGGWWCLVEWRSTRRRRWFLALSACIAWMAITRPLTALAYGIPVAVVVAVDLWRRRVPRRDVAAAGVVTLVIAALVPLTNAAVTGDARVMPWSEWARQYAPSERLGFGESELPPARELPPELARFNAYFAPIYGSHTVDTLPALFVERLRQIAVSIFGGYRIVLGAAALLAIIAMTAEMAFALGAGLLLVLAYLPFAHAPWALYYFELFPLLAVLSARGVAVGVTYLIGGSFGSDLVKPLRPIWVGLCAALVVVLTVHAGLAVGHARADRRERVSPLRRLFERVQELRGAKKMVFIRYAPDHNVHQSLIVNAADLKRASLWLVRDRRAENQRLIRSEPDRVAYIYDEATDVIRPYEGEPSGDGVDLMRPR